MAPSAVTDTWVATMLSAKHTHAVRSLDLSDACKITGESLAAIADTCPKFVCVRGFADGCLINERPATGAHYTTDNLCAIIRRNQQVGAAGTRQLLTHRQ